MAGAQVSGPGAFSQRTDTGGQPIRDLPDPDYGEAQAYRETQKGAPLSQAEGAPPATPPSKLAELGGGGPAPTPEVESPVAGMFDPGDPSIPVTAGAPLGDGPNEIAGLPGGAGTDFTPVPFTQALEPYVLSDHTGILAEIVNALSERGMY